MASWGIAMMADEPAALVAAWVGHHLELGASEVHVCLDRPNPEVHDLLSGVPGAVLHDDGEDGWSFNGATRRPPGKTARQKYHASRLLAQSGLDWLMHCDADEFLLPPEGTTVAEVLDGIEPEKSWVQVAVAERVAIRGEAVQDIFFGAYRLPWAKFATEGNTVYDEAECLLLHWGLCGHHIGKCMARTGRGLFIGVHHGLLQFSGAERDPAVERNSRLRVLHFDGLTRLHYAMKMLRYGLEELKTAPNKRHNPARWVQIHAMSEEAEAEERLRALYRAAKTISAAQAHALNGRHLLRHWTPEIAARAGRVLPNLPDLSPAAFDRVLLAREAAFFETVQAKLGFDAQSLAAK